MEKFKYGVMVLNPLLMDDNGDVPVVHFVGYWAKPKESDIENLIEEIRTDESFGLMDVADDLEYVLAPDDVVEYYNNIAWEEGVFNGEQDINEINLN